MILDDYQDAWAQDAPIDKANLEVEAGRVPILHARWWKFYSAERLKYRKQQIETNILRKNLLEYYTNKMLDEDREKLKWPPNPRLILSQNVDTYIDADPNMVEQASRLAYTEEVLRFLEDIIKQINNRGYTIKNMIDFMKFSMGV